MRSVSGRFVGALALLATLGAVLLLVAAASHERPAPDARPWRSSSPVVLGHATRSDHTLAAGRAAAEHFLRAYVGFLYGRRLPGDELASMTAELRNRLDRTRIRVPPARAQRTPAIAAMGSNVRGPGTVEVSALVNDGDLAPYRIAAVVEQRGRRWLVVRVAEP